MEIKQAAMVGTLESSDIQISIMPNPGKGLEIRLQSIVKTQYGDAIIAKNPDIAKSGFVFYVDPKETGNVIMLQKGADDLTNVINQILAQSETYWGAWYAAAQEISGIDQSYDDQGNAITG